MIDVSESQKVGDWGSEQERMQEPDFPEDWTINTGKLPTFCSVYEVRQPWVLLPIREPGPTSATQSRPYYLEFLLTALSQFSEQNINVRPA